MTFWTVMELTTYTKSNTEFQNFFRKWKWR